MNNSRMHLLTIFGTLVLLGVSAVALLGCGAGTMTVTVGALPTTTTENEPTTTSTPETTAPAGVGAETTPSDPGTPPAGSKVIQVPQGTIAIPVDAGTGLEDAVTNAEQFMYDLAIGDEQSACDETTEGGPNPAPGEIYDNSPCGDKREGDYFDRRAVRALMAATPLLTYCGTAGSQIALRNDRGQFAIITFDTQYQGSDRVVISPLDTTIQSSQPHGTHCLE